MRARVTVLVVALAVALSGCSGITGDETGTPPPAPRDAKRGGVLKVGITAPGGIDPLTAYEPAGKLISKTLCDTAVTIDPVTGQTREALARGWVATKNGVTVKLRRGVKFTDGRELRTEDVNYSLQQLVLPANGAFAADLGEQFLSIALAGAPEDVLADPDKAPDIAFSVSKYDLQVTPRANDGGALRAFAEPAMAPISASAHREDSLAFARNPVCVGPYVLEKPFANGDREIRLKRSEHYYGKNVGYTAGGVGYVDQIVFTIYPSGAEAVAAYDRGEVDVIQVPRDQVRNVADVGSLRFGLANAVEFVGLPTGPRNPFGVAALRVAASQAIDREQLVNDVFGPAAQVATGFEPPTLSIREGPSLKGDTTKGAPLTSCRGTTPPRPDLDAARASLKRAEVGAIPPITLEVNDEGVYPAMAEAIAAQWRSGLGLEVTVVKTPWDAYVAKAAGGVGFETPFRVRWSTDAIAPTATYNNRQSYLGGLLSGEATNTGANWGRWDDRAFQFGLSEEAAALTDVQQRGLVFNKLAQRLCEEMPMIPLVFDRPTFLVRSGVVGSARSTPVGRDGVLSLRELYLASQS